MPHALFDGRDTSAWRMCGPGGFVVVDGALETRGGMGVLWYAEREFTDFTLSLDWRVFRPEDNSGVHVRFPPLLDDPWVAVHEGYEMQINDFASGDRGTGAIYRAAAPFADPPLRPPGEWNHLDLRVQGQTYTVTINGAEVTVFHGDRRLSGHVGLQNHDEDSRVQFRDVLVLDG